LSRAGTRRTSSRMLAIMVGSITVVGIVAFVAQQRGSESAAAAPEKSSAKSATGSLTLDVTPQDAFVTIDGKPATGASPFVLSDLSVGMHKIMVAKGESYVAFEKDVEVEPGAALVLPVRLAAKEVVIQLETEPAKATITLFASGQAIASGRGGDSYKLVRASGTSYEIEASAPGYLPSRLALALTNEPTQVVQLRLAKETKVASASPNAVPSSSRRGSSKAAAVVPEPTVAEPEEEETEAEEQDTAGRSRGTKRSGAKSGGAKTAELKIGTAPGVPPAAVWLDGKTEGKTPKILKVSPGAHSIKWTWEDGNSSTQKVNVDDGQSIVVKGSK